MVVKYEQTGLKILNTVAFLGMIAVNALANIIPFNGRTTGEVSDLYPNLFTPAAFTFSIWGLIYVLLALFVLVQFGVFHVEESVREEAVNRIGWLFFVSCLANAGWIFAWHYELLPLSVLLMLVLLASLILIVARLKPLSLPRIRDKMLIRLPFSVYFGWITVATIANITALLVGFGWDGRGISEEVWTVLILSVGLLIAVAVMLKNRDSAYGLAVFWAYLGILVKHISPEGFASGYPVVIFTVCVCMAVLAGTAVSVFVSQRKNSFSVGHN